MLNFKMLCNQIVTDLDKDTLRDLQKLKEKVHIEPRRACPQDRIRSRNRQDLKGTVVLKLYHIK